MSKLEELIAEYCPNGVEYKPLWSLTAWDKKFNGLDRKMQSKVITYKYYLSAEFDAVVICTPFTGQPVKGVLL